MTQRGCVLVHTFPPFPLELDGFECELGLEGEEGFDGELGMEGEEGFDGELGLEGDGTEDGVSVGSTVGLGVGSGEGADDGAAVSGGQHASTQSKESVTRPVQMQPSDGALPFLGHSSRHSPSPLELPRSEHKGTQLSGSSGP